MDDLSAAANTNSEAEKQEHRFRDRFNTFVKQDGLTVLIVLVLVTAYALLRTSGDTFESVEALQQSMINPHPTIIEFYSNNCSICLTSKPKVVQLERDLRQTARVLKLNVKEPVNQALAAQWGVQGVPTFFILDPKGEIVYARAGAPDIQTITNMVLDISETN